MLITVEDTSYIRFHYTLLFLYMFNSYIYHVYMRDMCLYMKEVYEIYMFIYEINI